MSVSFPLTQRPWPEPLGLVWELGLRQEGTGPQGGSLNSVTLNSGHISVPPSCLY